MKNHLRNKMTKEVAQAKEALILNQEDLLIRVQNQVTVKDNYLITN
jgi:hypothetical protein